MRLGLGVALTAAFLWGCSSDDADGADAKDAGSGGQGGVEAGVGGDSGSVGGTAGGSTGGSGGTSFDGPAKLSETGLYADIATRQVAADVIPFAPRYATWVDGLTSNRWLRLPPGTQIDTSLMNFWSFPVGTQAWKDFAKDGQLIETRYLERRADGWLEVSYAWDDAGTDALAAPQGVPNALGTSHDIPSSDDCTQCHDGEPSRVLGASAIQLSREGTTGPLTDLANAGLLSDPPSAEFPVPGDGVVEDALGSLHANCGHCHNDTHYLAAIRFVRYRLDVADVNPEDTPTYKTNLVQSQMNHVVESTIYSIVPGKPYESQTFVRINKRNLYSMPPLDTKEVDVAGVQLIESWISGLP